MTDLPSPAPTAPAESSTDLALDRFHNALRIMRSIDMVEMVAAGIIPSGDIAAYRKFADDPYYWFIIASDEDARRVWAIIQSRQPERLR